MKAKNLGSRVEKEIVNEVAKEEGKIKKLVKKPEFKVFIMGVIFLLIIIILFYFDNASSRIYIENSEVVAPVISLSSASAGVLDSVFVKPGDLVSYDMIVASVSGMPIKAKADGIVVAVQNTPGQIVSSQSSIVEMVDRSEMRIVGHIQEDKGLQDVKQWQKVEFTLDAFPGKKFEGVVDSIQPISRQQDIVFSISDKRQEKEFDVSVRFDVSSHPEILNGMSAKMWIYK